MRQRRPYRLTAFGTSPASAGEAKMPIILASPVRTGEGDRGAVEGGL